MPKSLDSELCLRAAFEYTYSAKAYLRSGYSLAKDSG